MIHFNASVRPASAQSRHRGFTLIELMITVAIVAILTAVALPSYRDYVLRGYLVDATSLLTSYQAQMERYYQDNRTYASTGSGTSLTTPPCSVTPAPQQGKFALSCNLTTPTNGYTLTATGSGPVTGFAYTLTNLNVQGTSITGVPGWNASSTSCWIVKKGATSC